MAAKDVGKNSSMSRIEEYMNTRMVSRDFRASVLDIAKTMVDWSISSVAITDKNKKIVGILTERDIVRIIARGAFPDKINAGSLMSTSLVSISKDLPVEEAARLMAQTKVRHLLVEDPSNHGVIGIITVTDLARYVKQKMTTGEGEIAVMSEVWELFF